jgi:hypothetical protein
MSEEQLNSAIGDPPQIDGAMYAQTTGDPPPAEGDPPPADDDLTEQVPQPDGDPPPNLPSGGNLEGDPPPN